MRKAFILLAVAASLAGCAVTQPKPPQLDLPPPSADSASPAALSHWWTAFAGNRCWASLADVTVPSASSLRRPP